MMDEGSNERTHQVCVRCVMDTTDPEIHFDASGVCNHCHAYDIEAKKLDFGREESERRLNAIVTRVRNGGKGKRYDCVIGLSGGVDSTFLAYRAKSLGLRPIAVHLDNGWDTEIAVKNIQNAVSKLDIDLITHVLDWEEFRDLQTAFLRASTPDSEIPSDHAITAVLAQTATRTGVRSVISGSNHRTESHLPLAWSSGHVDWLYIRSVHQQFGRVPLKTFPHLGFFKARDYLSGTQRIDLLNFLDYSKTDAMELLKRELGWQSFSGKHHESIYTRFYQGYILPKKFGYDKRKSHLSSLVCSGEISREQALCELKNEPYDPALQKADVDYVSKKLELSPAEFDAIMKTPPRSFWDFPSYARIARGKAYLRTRRVYREVFRRNLTPKAPSAS